MSKQEFDELIEEGFIPDIRVSYIRDQLDPIEYVQDYEMKYPVSDEVHIGISEKRIWMIHGNYKTAMSMYRNPGQVKMILHQFTNMSKWLEEMKELIIEGREDEL